MNVPVVWCNANPEAPARGYWDQALLEDLLWGHLWQPAGGCTFYPQDPDQIDSGGAVVVVPGGANADRAEDLYAYLCGLEWALLIITSDEEHLFPLDRARITIPHAVWRQYARPGDDETVKALPIGYTPGTREHMARYWAPGDAIRWDWAFAGQANHDRRRECVAALLDCDGARGVLAVSEGFAQGLDQDTYLRLLATTKLAPCPSGHVHVDSFRLYEALEAGAVPIADDRTATDTVASGSWFWPRIFSGWPWTPLVATSWAGAMDTAVHEVVHGYRWPWPMAASRVGAAWQAAKRDLANELTDTVRMLNQADEAPPAEKDQRITVLIPTSPIPSHPSLEILEETIASVRYRLPHAEIIVMCDGVRDEQADRADDYEAYLRQLVWQCAHRWHNVLPVIEDDHQHQANITRRALDLVRTPLVLFVEHDTPLVGDRDGIEWAGLVEVILHGDANAVRFHYDETVHPDHQHLMLDERSLPIAGHRDHSSPWGLRTVQWSQRPHLALTEWYRHMIAAHFPASSRTMIEDKLHGVIQDAPWEEHRVWVYDPEARPDGGGMKRSTHLDGRGDDPKYPMDYGR